ncbi:MAG: hypothetical protein ACJ751_06100 [Niastella sp.]|uniref:hypothetical protein n=1 Tax=Niastella sp. TaxID=1869183 RepID=UPI00389A1103
MNSVHPIADTASASKQELAIRYPALRQFNVVTYGYGYGNFDAKINDQDFASGKTKTFRTSSFINTPALQWSGNALSATIFYTYTSTRLKDNINYLSDPKITPLTSDKSTFDLALNYSRSDKIFHHPIIYSAIVNFISDHLRSARRFNFNGSFSLPLIKKENTSLSVGALFLIDPSSPSPVLPIVNYYHRFTSSNIELIVDLPTGINLKKQIVKNTWVSVGSNQNSYSTFYNSHEGLLNGKVSYNTIEVRSGLLFEYLFAKKLILGLGGGINNTVSSRLFKDGERYNNPTVMSNNRSVPYVNLGLSLLPF